ncbi:MAG: M48 family metallopeptidase [Lachnospiraceae bacterium]|nr:M48 family metallopeptidase [Lachnospiraceae bacterium]
MISYTVVRSNRKTLALQVRPDGVTVRAPRRCTDAEIERFVSSRTEWIEKTLTKLKMRRQRLEAVDPLSEEELRSIRAEARRVIPERVKYYASLAGVTYRSITIRLQRTRWGSCSSRGTLSFNCLLMLTPPEVLDSVIVHELCHLKEMNHSKRFYEEVLRIYPDYYRWNKWLRENGDVLMRRARGDA